MAKRRTVQSEIEDLQRQGVTTEQVLEWIQDRRKLLDTLEQSVLAVSSIGAKAAPKQRSRPFVPKAGERVSRPQESPTIKVKRGTTRDMIRKILASGPLSTGEVFTRLQNKGWQTTSNNPRTLLDVTLRAMRDYGHIQKVGADWELASKVKAAQAVEPTEPAASAEAAQE